MMGVVSVNEEIFLQFLSGVSSFTSRLGKTPDSIAVVGIVCSLDLDFWSRGPFFGGFYDEKVVFEMMVRETQRFFLCAPFTTHLYISKLCFPLINIV